MEKCIHPDCTCTGYKEPAAAKGTLLLLRLGCKECSHVPSEHRRLTAVDTLIADEIQVASTKGCVHQIPVLDVPRSPVFGSHDPIHLPWGDMAQDCSVVCTCAGFMTPSVVGLQQAFHKRVQSEVQKELPLVTCTFCRHPLSAHQGRDPGVASGLSELAILGRLRFKGIAQLHNLHQPSLLTLDYIKRCFVFICLQSSTEIVAVTTYWDKDEKTSNDGALVQVTMETEASTQNEPIAMEMSNLSVVTEMSTKEEPVVKATKKKGRTKRKRFSGGIQRKSARLEAKRQSSEEAANKEPKKPEVVVPEEATEQFVRDLGQSASWEKVGTLPEKISAGSTTLTALSTQSSGLVLAATSTTLACVGVVNRVEGVVWSPLQSDQQSGRFTCLSLMESDSTVLIAMGTSNGEVMYWTFKAPQQTELVTCDKEAKHQITTVKWSPDATTLAAGCFHGDVLLYTCKDGLNLIQRVNACGGSVLSMAWSQDSRMLAVGGSDDCVQVIADPPTSDQKSTVKQHNNLFNYFKRPNQKFQHSLTLRGHQSFVAEVHFTRSGLLLTLGWDGQVLVWTPSHPHTSQHSHPHIVDSDPAAGFKIGPSTSTKFQPLSVTAVDNGLLVTVSDKYSEMSVIHYSL